MTIVYKPLELGKFSKNIRPVRLERARALHSMSISGNPVVRNDGWACCAKLAGYEDKERPVLYFTKAVLKALADIGWSRREVFQAVDDLVRAGLVELTFEKFVNTEAGA